MGLSCEVNGARFCYTDAAFKGLNSILNVRQFSKVP